MLETGGHPVAYGAWLGAPGAPTILIYGHHDVQPVDPLDLWTSPPFDASVRDGKIFGRGAVDDKGQCLMHLAALEAHLRVTGRLPLNIKVVIEGEEEVGSVHFESFLAREQTRLACDVVVVSDTAVFAEDVPFADDVTARPRRLGSRRARSDQRHPLGLLWRDRQEPAGGVGTDLGGPQRQRRHRRGAGILRRACAIFRRLSATRSQRFPSTTRREARALGVPALAGEAGRLALERMWTRPTLEINGCTAVIRAPGRRRSSRPFARAKLTARLVPHQDPAHVKRVVTGIHQAACAGGRAGRDRGAR